MPDRQTETRVVISAHDRASAVFAQVRRNAEGMSRHLTAGLRQQGAGWGALAGSITAAAGVIAAAAPEIRLPLLVVDVALKRVLGIVAQLVGAIRSVAGAAWRGLGAIADAAAAAARPLLQLAERALGAVIERLRQLPRYAALALAALTAVATAGVVASVRAAATVETAMVGFETMLRSGRRAAAEFTQSLLRFAAQTSFQFAQLLDPARQLLAFGFDVRQIIPMMRDLGDAIGALGGGGEVLARVIMNMGQIKAIGRVTMREMRDFASAGIPVFDILSTKLGVTAQQMRQLAELAIPAEQFFPAFLEGLRERFGGGMLRQMSTFSGMLSNLVDSLFLLGVSIGNALLPIFRQVLPLLTEQVTALAGRVGPFIERLVAFGRALLRLDAVRSILYNVAFALASLYAVFLRPVAGDAGSWVVGVVNTTARAVQWLVDHVFNPRSLEAARQWLTGLYREVAERLGAAINWLQRNAGTFRDIGQWIVGAFRYWVSYAGEWLRYFYEVLRAYLTPALQFIDGVVTALSGKLGGLWADLPSIVQRAIEGFAAVGLVLVALKGLAQRFVDMFIAGWGIVLGLVSTGANAFMTVVNVLAQALRLLTQFQPYLRPVGDAIAGLAGDLREAVNALNVGSWRAMAAAAGRLAGGYKATREEARFFRNLRENTAREWSERVAQWQQTAGQRQPLQMPGPPTGVPAFPGLQGNRPLPPAPPAGYAARPERGVSVSVTINGSVNGVDDLQRLIRQAVEDGITQSSRTAQYSVPFGYSY